MSSAVPSLVPSSSSTIPNLNRETGKKGKVEDTQINGNLAKTVAMAEVIPSSSSSYNYSYKWRLLISYVGTRYSGWQYQVTPPTIQCCLEKALMVVTKLERDDLCVVGASRTDTGVHARGQVAHFVTPFNYESLENIHSALNGLLPRDIRVREFSAAVPDFHARFSVTSKIYHYKIYNDAVMDPFQRPYAYHSVYKLNTAVMREAAKHFVGKHDFSAFVNTQHNDRQPNPVKSIFRVDIIEMGPLLQVEVEGSGFLYRQIRNMVALLLQIGREAVPPDIVPIILATRDRKELAKVALSAPPHGLYLMDIKYNEDHLQLPSGSPETSFVAGNFYGSIVCYVMIHAGASPRPFFGTRSSNSIDFFVSLILESIMFYLFVRMIVVKFDRDQLV